MQPSPFARPNSPQITRGSSTGERSRARGRGRGRGRGSLQSATPSTPSDNSASPFSSRGNVQRAGLGGFTRGVRSRGIRGTARGQNNTRVFSTPSLSPSHTNNTPAPPIDPRPEDVKETNHEAIGARRTKLHGQYEQYQKRAIQQKLMSDPDKREKLENAIFTKGTCTHMCDEKERVDRIFESQLDRAETLPHPETGQLVPIEGRMVKRFRRSAAGVGKQIPEELRTPQTLQRTMDYLINNIIGPNPRLAQHHKFVWDRTRAIRNDCSIQSFTQPEDVKLEVDCYERIARFHILSAHILSKPDALRNGEDFVHKQEIEQLTKTFQTLIDKYDGYGQTLAFPHEAEFRAYFILFAPMTTIADLDDQVQKWPSHILNDGRVQTALRLRAAAESTDQPVGSRRFEPVPCFIAQKNSGLFWDLLRSQRVGYLMACTAEMSFRNIRFAALDSLWRASKNAPEKGRASMRTWTKAAVRDYLGFDDEDQAEDFCSKFAINFVGSAGQEYVDFKSHSEPSLDYSLLGQDQVFSETIVEEKRQGRTLVAVLNGMSIAAAAKAGLITQEYGTDIPRQTSNKSNMFVSQDDEDDEDVDEAENITAGPSSSILNPLAGAFTPGSSQTSASGDAVAQKPGWMTSFGSSRPSTSTHSGLFSTPFGGGATSAVPANVPAQSPFQSLGIAGQSSQPSSSVNFASTLSPSTKDTATKKVLFQPVFASQNKDGTKSSQNSSGSWQFAPLAQETTTTSAAPIQPTFSWSKPTSEVTSTTTPPQSIFNASQPAKPLGDIPKFSFGLDTTPAPSQPQPPQFGVARTEQFDKSSKAFERNSTTEAPHIPKADQLPSQATDLLTDQATTSLISAQPSPKVDSTITKLNTPASPPSFAPPPSSQAFKFPPVFKPVTESSTTISTESPARSQKLLNTKPETPPLESTTNQTVSAGQPLPTSSPEQPPAPQRKPVDKDQLVEHLCKIGLTQKDGILDMFVAAKVNSLCLEAHRAFQTYRLNSKLAKLKKIHLKRKFFALWRVKANSLRLQRRAEKRKQMFIDSVKKQLEREQRQREEVAMFAEIRKSEEHKRRIQEEERKKEQEKEKQQAAELERLQAQNDEAARLARRSRPIAAQAAGRKRKLLNSKPSRSNLQDVAMSPMHKRSRTLGAVSDSLQNSPATSWISSIVKTPSTAHLRRSMSQKSLRQSVSSQAVDRTESDYFRLKALGVDPNTPLIPDTAAGLAARKKREAEHREAVLSRVKFRSRAAFTSQSPREVEDSVEVANAILAADSVTTTQSPSRTSPLPEEIDDPFLRELRETRQAMAANTEWLKSEAAKLDKEAEQQEELRRSIGSNPSIEEPPPRSANGFSRSLNGYEYVAPVLKPGQTLSRTEQRIRLTGARGLATCPIGGSPRSTPQYTPVAMSRRTASQLYGNQLSNQITSPSTLSKRSIDEVEVSNGVADSEPSTQSGTERVYQPAIKRPRHNPFEDSAPRMSIQALEFVQHDQNHHQNGYDNDSPDYEITEEDETGDEVDYVGQAQNGNTTYAYDNDEDEDQYSGDLDDNENSNEDSEGEDYSDEEEDPTLDTTRPLGAQYDFIDAEAEEYDEEDEEEVPGSYGYNPPFESLAPPPASASGHGSRAVSAGVATPDTGLGSTVDDAIELSD